MTKAKEKTKDDVIQPVYIHPLTDFGFKKFNKQPSELENNTDTWLFLLKNTFELKKCPPEIKGKIFKLFLEIAEVKHLTPKEMETYKKSLENNYYVLDIANCARMEGEQAGIVKGRMEERRQLASKLLIKGTPIEEVIFLTELSKEQVAEVLERLPKS